MLECLDEEPFVEDEADELEDGIWKLAVVGVRSILYDDGSSFACWFDDNVAIGLQSTDGVVLYLGVVLHYLISAANESGIHAFCDGLSSNRLLCCTEPLTNAT
eukprot:g19402.t1